MTRSAVARRRFVTIPVTLLVAAVVTVAAPVLLVVASAVDVVRFIGARKPFVAVRMVMFGWVYLVAEVVALGALAVAWITAGWGRGRPARLGRSAFRLQEVWARSLLRAFLSIFSMRLEVSGGDAVAPGPIVVMMRHASIADTLLPNVLVTSRHGIRLRYILKRELLVDPALDIAGNRLDNVFVDRAGDTKAEIERVRALGQGLGEGDGMLIYPEGTRFTESKRERALAALAKRRSPISDRARRLRHVLPPRPGGSLALVDLGVDVVVVAHVGLDGFAEVKDVWDGRIIGSTLRVAFWRIPASEIPADRRGRVDWLLAQWERVDAWIEEHRS